MSPRFARLRPRAIALAFVAVTLVISALLAGRVTSASAAVSQITNFSVSTSSPTAGAHSDLSVDVRLATGHYPDVDGADDEVYPLQSPKTFVVDLPPGVLANPTAMPSCRDADVASAAYIPPPTIRQDGGACNDAAQVGYMNLTVGNAYGPPEVLFVPIYNLDRSTAQTARLAAYIDGELIHFNIALRDTSDYGARATVTNLPAALPFYDADVVLWGNPSDPSHDGQRGSCYANGLVGNQAPSCFASVPGSTTFIINPASCTGPTTANVSVDFYDRPGQPDTATAPIAPFSGCQSLPFAPSLSLAPDSGAVGQPAGYTASLTVPQPAMDDPSALQTASVDDVSVTLPAGVALSPGVVSGLSACSDAEFGQGSDAPPSCPASSAIGTASIVSPLASNPVTGEIYVGSQQSSDPASGRMYRIFLSGTGDGVTVKLVGAVSADPSTGRLTATFPQNPQVPFSSLRLSFASGPQAPLANPQTCGTATSNWSISSYANPAAPVSGQSSFPVTGDCGSASQFTPSLSAGTQNDQAGASSPFSFTLTRPDGQQVMSAIPYVALPLGLNADLADVPQCADASASAGNCPAASQVGVATVQAGSGSAPFALADQPIYLTGPYKGGPFGLAEVIHAVAGPFDLGTVVVRQSLTVDPRTAQVTIASDPLPTILGGVPLNLRSISLNIDRPGFMRSPTSCAARSIQAYVRGTAPGQAASVAPGSVGYATSTASTVHLSEPYQAGECAKLAFSPKLGIALAATHRTTPGSHPRLTATLTQAAGQANLHSAKVSLPLSLALDPNNSQHVCSVKAAAKIACPSRTVVGSATADTRILPHPLTGKVYLVQGIRYDKQHRSHKTLPTLLIPLRGADHVAIDLTAKTSVDSHSRLVTTFASIPDAAIAKFTLAIIGGRKGILVVTGSKSLCQVSRSGDVTEGGQNGKDHDGTFALQVGRACRRRP